MLCSHKQVESRLSKKMRRMLEAYHVIDYEENRLQNDVSHITCSCCRFEFIRSSGADIGSAVHTRKV
uniref:hypothetical protein n=1 Tax=Paenibacillus sp. FSL K6-3182 TaxID=2921495 RepID=UPI00403F98DF